MNGVVIGSGLLATGLNAQTIVNRMQDSWEGFYANCKSWVIETDMSMIEFEGRIIADLGLAGSLRYREEGHYDCHSGLEHTVEVDWSRVRRFNREVSDEIDRYCYP